MKDNKSIAKNSIFNIAYKGFTALFPLLTTSYISRILLAEGVGKVSYATAIVMYFVVFASLGIPNYGIKAIASKSDSVEEKSKCFIEILLVNTISTTCCVIAYYFLVNFTDLFCDKVELMNVMGILLVLNYLNIDWFYQGIEEYRFIAIRSIIVKIVSFFAMLVFVKTKSDYLNYAMILCLATGGNYVLNFINAKKYIKIKNSYFNLKQHLRPIVILLAAALATEVYTMLDTVMLEYFHGDSSVGYYSNAVKIVRMIYTVTVALVATFYPRISKYYSEHRQQDVNALLSVGLKILLILSIPCSVGLFFTASYIVPLLLGDSFEPSICVLQILAILVFVFSIAFFLGHIVLMSTGNENKILKATIFGAIVNACMNLVLIPRFAESGASIASVVSEIIVTIILINNSKKFFKIHITKQFLISLFTSTLALVGIVFIFEKLLAVSLGNLFILISVAGLIYFVFLIILKNDFILPIWNKLIKKGVDY